MAIKTLAVAYRPKTWSEVEGQGSTKIILQQQLETGDVRNSYLFCGASGCGKTTCARIFANELNKGKDVPIEMDAASHSSVDDVREIIKMAQTRNMKAEYKVFIVDECHMISNAGWNAMLKLIEEPPAKSIFIFCTTNPEKIPKTILNRVQRYDFKRIPLESIVDRMKVVIRSENEIADEIEYTPEALDYIARQSKGGMRDALALLDKCLAYSTDLTLENVLTALELSDVETFTKLTEAVLEQDRRTVVDVIEKVYADGEDMKQFIKQYMNFVLDVTKWYICEDFKYTQLAETKEMKEWLNKYTELDTFLDLLDRVIEIDSAIKFSNSAKEYIETQLITF